MRKLIRAAAKASAGAGVGATAQVAPSAKPVPTRASADVSQDQVRALLQRKTAERRGLGAELARKLGVERTQVSRFKAGTEAFPASKLGDLHGLLISER
jgi:hypothetical protein